MQAGVEAVVEAIRFTEVCLCCCGCVAGKVGARCFEGALQVSGFWGFANEFLPRCIEYAGTIQLWMRALGPLCGLKGAQYFLFN